MKKEVFEVINNNKPKVAIGLLIAGLALTQSELRFNDYSTLQEMRQADNSPTNRFRLDYGGNVKWLKDQQTGAKWDALGKDQCLKGTEYDSSKVFEYEENNQVIVAPLNQPVLRFTGLQNTNRRLQPADSFTEQYLFSKECQVNDH